MRPRSDFGIWDRIVVGLFSFLVFFLALAAVAGLKGWKPGGLLGKVGKVAGVEGAIACVIITLCIFIYAIAKPDWVMRLLIHFVRSAFVYFLIVLAILLVGSLIP